VPIFARIVGIDYSGAKTPTTRMQGLRFYSAKGGASLAEVMPRLSTHKHWTRKGLAEWLIERLAEDVPTLVGIGHGFSRCAILRHMASGSTGWTGDGAARTRVD
jgi:hypothetical protein